MYFEVTTIFLDFIFYLENEYSIDAFIFYQILIVFYFGIINNMSMIVRAMSNLRGDGLKFHFVPNIKTLENRSKNKVNEVNNYKTRKIFKGKIKAFFNFFSHSR